MASTETIPMLRHDAQQVLPNEQDLVGSGRVQKNLENKKDQQTAHRRILNDSDIWPATNKEGHWNDVDGKSLCWEVAQTGKPFHTLYLVSVLHGLKLQLPIGVLCYFKGSKMKRMVNGSKTLGLCPMTATKVIMT